MSVEITVENCQFYENASVIRYNNDIEETRERLLQKQQSEYNRELLIALNELKKALDDNSKKTVKKVVTDFSVQFSSSLFASIASAALKGLVQGFL